MKQLRASREDLIRRYEEGPVKLRDALAKVPPEALQWRPGPGKWSVHEVICHCGDSETVAAGRVRYLVAEEKPLLVAFDQDRWARTLDYHSRLLAPEMASIMAVRASTAALLRSLPEQAWAASGTHTERGPMTTDDWLETAAEHLETHVRQIEKNLAAWEESQGDRESNPRS